MNRTQWQRMIFAALMGFGFLTGVGRCEDDPPGRAKPAGPTPAPAVTSKVESEPTPVEAEHGEKQRRPLQKILHPIAAHRERAPREPDEVRLGCYSHFNDYTCGSLKADGVFILGSCRSFFGERCIKAPPPFPVEGFDRNWLYPDGVPPERKKHGLFGLGLGCRDCQ